MITTEEIYEKLRKCGFRLTTDSRAISGGEIFLALKGENFDGNDYALKALGDGAAYAVVCEDAVPAENSRLLKVKNTQETLSQLGALHRNRVLGDRHLPVIGLTGTNGKTTTKELINAVLSRKYKVTATKGNLNNDIGVPLTLLSITEDTEIAVVEMGANHPDDIAKLVKVSQPDYGLITNVGKAHLLGFGSFEGVKAAKGELYRWLGSHPGSVIFINEDDADLREMASREACHQYGYGIGYQGAKLLPTTADMPFLGLQIGERKLQTKLVGSYNANNVLAALCIGEYFGVPADDAFDAISSYTPANNRSQLMDSGRNKLVVDAYNANPSSMKAALDNFAAIEAPLKYALLGDMRELGEDSLKEHETIVSMVVDMIMTRRLDGAFLVGDEFGKALGTFADRNLTLMGLAGPSIWHCDTSDDLAAYLEDNRIDGAAILIKGSRGIRMEKTIEKL